MLRKARYCLVSGLWTLFVCTVAQGALISVDNVVRSYDGSAVTSDSTNRYSEGIWESENGLGALPTAVSTSSHGGGYARASGVRASAQVNDINDTEAELIFATGTSASHRASIVLWTPSYAKCAATVDFVGSIKLSDVFASGKVAFLSERQSRGSENTGTLTISSGTTELFTSTLAALPQELFYVTALPGATVTIHVSMRSYSYQGHGEYAHRTYSDEDSQDFRLQITPVDIIHVDPNSDIAAANADAKAGDTIEFAAGTYAITEAIEIKDGVTYMGAGPGLTIIDGNDTTRAFVAWGDRSFNEANENPNDSGPKDWVLEGMTIQNCVADTNDRFSYTGAAYNLKTNFVTLDVNESGGLDPNEANGQVGGIRLAGEDGTEGTDDDDLHRFEHIDNDGSGELSEAELDAQLLLQEDEFGGQNGDGGAITILNQSVGTIQNCEFLNNHTPAEGDGDDGGAISISGLSIITINDCLFDGNYAVSPDSVAVEGWDGDGGHIKVQGNSASALTPGTTLIANRCVFLNGNASDDGGAIQSAAVGSVVRLDSCWFEGNTSWDNGNVCQFSNNTQHEVTVTNCIFVNNVTKADNSPDRMIETNRNSKFINCTFVGNNQEDQDMIYNNANIADTDGDGVDDETADATLVINCIFANNVVGNGDDVLGSRDDAFTIVATNCLFFGNTLQNGNNADNTQSPAEESGSVMADPLLDAEYVPGAGSPAIDAGVDPAAVGVTLMTDYNGVARPQGAAYDIGAFEVVPPEE
ncbi:MAG: choice-of-anchor Q domain-containing protein [Sedimentisphaerales bacterium]